MDQNPEVPQTDSGLKLTSYRDVKDHHAPGEPGTPRGDEAYELQLRQELRQLLQQRIEQLGARLLQLGTIGEFYLDLPGVLTTSIAPGYSETAQVDYLFYHPGGLVRLFDDHDAGHELTEQDGYVLEQLLTNVLATDNPSGYPLADEPAPLTDPS